MSKRAIKSNKIKTAIKYLVLSLIFIVAIVFSVLTSGYLETAKKFLMLLICATAGFILFYAIYGLCYLITLWVYKLKRNKHVKNQITCNSDIEKLVTSPKYNFKYNRKLSLNENIKELLSLLKVAVSDVSKGFDKGGKYYFLNYTVYDALGFIKTTVQVANDKFEKPLKRFKLYNKPIGLVEKKLSEVIEGEQPKKSSKLASGAIKVGTFFFKGAINNACNDFISYVLSEAYNVYGKDKSSFDFTKIEVEYERDN